MTDARGSHTAKIVILTGAGVSAESGIPTFRDANGLWRTHRIGDVASPRAFARTPELVHEFYDARRRAAAAAEPNAAHLALAQLEQALGDDVLIVTQNVDDLHERAGAKNVIHVHGELASALCTACESRHAWTGDLGGRPACPTCRERTLRPDIVWFGENVYRWDEIEAAVRHCDLFVVAGTSGIVSPASGLAARARAVGAGTVLINLEDPPGTSSYDTVLLGPASVRVPEWVRAQLGEEAQLLEDGLEELPLVLRERWLSDRTFATEAARRDYQLRHPQLYGFGGGDLYDEDYPRDSSELLLSLDAARIENAREWVTTVAGYRDEDWAQAEADSAAEEERRTREKSLMDAARKRAELRRTRLGRLENLFIEVGTLADAPFDLWCAKSKKTVPGLAEGAQDAVFGLHSSSYNVVLVAPFQIHQDGWPAFLDWYTRHFASSEGYWPDQLLLNASQFKLRGWDFLVSAEPSRYRGEGTLLQFGSKQFPDWSAIHRYLLLRPDDE